VSKSKAYEDWRVLAEAGRYEEALGCIRRCLESEPDNGGAWNDMGAALFCLGRAKEAAAEIYWANRASFAGIWLKGILQMVGLVRRRRFLRICSV